MRQSKGSNVADTDRLTKLIAQVLRLKPAEIVDSLDMEDAGTWDSLSHMELIASIEDAFGVELTADEIVAMRSVQQIKAVLRGKSVAV